LPDGSDYVVKQGDTLSKIAQGSIKDIQSKIAAPKDDPANKSKSATAQAGKVGESSTAQKAEAAESQRRDAAKNNKPSQEDKNLQSQSQKTATLDDVVKSLDMLNKMLGQLISVNEDMGKQQIRALKNNSGNLYEKYMP
jgi:membrane protein involved in colicin uptake